jgi:hypothetical protein
VLVYVRNQAGGDHYQAARQWSACQSRIKERSMPAIVIVLLFLVLFLTAFLVVLLGPFVGLGWALWKNSKTAAQSSSGVSGN